MVDYYPTEEGTEREHMEDIEKEIYADNITISYEGLFSYKELLDLINEWARSKRYFKEVLESKEKVTRGSKNITLELQMQRRIHAQYKCLINFSLEVSDMVDEEEEIDQNMKNLNSGRVEASLKGFLMTSQRSRWETRGYVAFIRGIINKFVYKLDRPAYIAAVVGDAKDLTFKIRGFLNSYPKRNDKTKKDSAE